MTPLMNISPLPVPDNAQVWLYLKQEFNNEIKRAKREGERTKERLTSAYVPAPMIGESPTLPTGLFVIPPVDVPAHIIPFVYQLQSMDNAEDGERVKEKKREDRRSER